MVQRRLGLWLHSAGDGGVEALVREEAIAGNGSGSLEEDAEVTYEVVQGREGPEAKKVSVG